MSKEAWKHLTYKAIAYQIIHNGLYWLDKNDPLCEVLPSDKAVLYSKNSTRGMQESIFLMTLLFEK